MFPANAKTLLVPPRGRGVLLGDEAFQFLVVGTLQHQAELEKIAGSRNHLLRCAALLTPQLTNPYDPEGIAVTIHRQEVGFLPWMDGRDFRHALHMAGYAEAACEAEIVGKRDSGDGEWEYVGVRLNACLPFTIMSADDWFLKRAQPGGSPARDRDSP
jgi:hypothetical protein